MENKGFGFENEAKKRPQINISVDVAKKCEKNQKYTHTSATGGRAPPTHRTAGRGIVRYIQQPWGDGLEGNRGYILIRSSDGDGDPPPLGPHRPL